MNSKTLRILFDAANLNKDKLSSLIKTVSSQFWRISKMSSENLIFVLVYPGSTCDLFHSESNEDGML